MDARRRLGLALVGGIALTLVTGVVPLRTLPGATQYGLPMAWLIRRVLAPEFFPWRVSWLGLVVDLVVWSTLAALVLLIAERFGRRRPSKR